MKSRTLKRIIRILQDERGSVYLEYGLTAGMLLTVGIAVFTPGSFIWQSLGWDLEFRYILMRLPIF